MDQNEAELEDQKTSKTTAKIYATLKQAEATHKNIPTADLRVVMQKD